MQIGHLHHITYPGVDRPSVTGNVSDNATDAALGTPLHGPGATVRQTTPAQDAPGVIAQIQSDSDGTNNSSVPSGLVYSNARKAAAPEDTDADTARMAEQHRQAVERSAGNASNLSLDKDGVLVAKPRDFVTFAVNTMREYADAQARLKVEKTQTDTSTLSPLIPRSLGDVQKLAARFKLFA